MTFLRMTTQGLGFRVLNGADEGFMGIGARGQTAAMGHALQSSLDFPQPPFLHAKMGAF